MTLKELVIQIKELGYILCYAEDYMTHYLFIGEEELENETVEDVSFINIEYDPYFDDNEASAKIFYGTHYFYSLKSHKYLAKYYGNNSFLNEANHVINSEEFKTFLTNMSKRHVSFSNSINFDKFYNEEYDS